MWLSPEDRDRYEGVEHEVIDELCAYLLEHARREDLILASPPHIAFHTDERLALGEFGIQARLVRAEDHQQRRATRAARPPGRARPDDDLQHLRAPREARSRRPRRAAARPARCCWSAGGACSCRRGGGVIGRSRDCEIVLEDAGVSRRHAELRPAAGEGWTVADLGSTNGVRVNGAAASAARAALQPGDRLELGSTEIVFELRMNTLEPVSVALKFGFLAVLYLFLLWVARSARRDLGGRASLGSQPRRPRSPRSPRMRPACTRPRRWAAPASPTARRAWSSSAPPVTIRG